jgi:hypothetical protein
MLKWVVLLLVFLNLAIAFWGWNNQPDSRKPVIAEIGNVESIQLLEELSPSDQARLEKPTEEEVAQAQAEALPSPLQPLAIEVQRKADLMCRVFSIDDRAMVVAVFDRIKSWEVDAYVGEQSVQTPGAVMVYVPPFGSFRAAQIEIGNIRAQGIDGFIIPDGELANGISAGVFNSEENIAQRRQQLRELGYQTAVYQYIVDRLVFGVNIPLSAYREVAENRVSELSEDFPQLTSVQNSCWKVASTSNFN